MWIQVKSMDGKKVVRLDGLSKLTKIDDLRPMLISHFDCKLENQKLFYRGKMVSVFKNNIKYLFFKNLYVFTSATSVIFVLFIYIV